MCAEQGEVLSDDNLCMAVYNGDSAEGYCIFSLSGDFADIKAVNCSAAETDGLLRSAFSYAAMHGAPFVVSGREEIRALFHKHGYCGAGSDTVCAPELFMSGCGGCGKK